MNDQPLIRTDHDTPFDLQDIARNIDALAAAQRACARPGFEDHIHASTVDLLNPQRLKLVPAPFVRAPSHRWFSPLRVAAAIALFSTIGITYLAMNGRGNMPAQTFVTTDTGAAIADIEHWLSVAGSEDTANTVDAEIDLLLADTQKLFDGIHTAPAADGGAL